MLTLNEETPIYLETLNAEDQPIAEIAARLRHLSAQSAVVAFEGGVETPGLRWGSRVRFCLESEARRYAIVGMVVATDLRGGDCGASDPDAPREILLNVWDCRFAEQRREAPRSRVRFAVKYQCLPAGAAESETWLAAHCIDLSAGGMRLRTACPETEPERIRIALSLPETASGSACDLDLTGRVLRMERPGGLRQMAVMAVKFERLTPQNALHLTRHA